MPMHLLILIPNRSLLFSFLSVHRKAFFLPHAGRGLFKFVNRRNQKSLHFIAVFNNRSSAVIGVETAIGQKITPRSIQESAIDFSNFANSNSNCLLFLASLQSFFAFFACFIVVSKRVFNSDCCLGVWSVLL